MTASVINKTVDYPRNRARDISEVEPYRRRWKDLEEEGRTWRAHWAEIEEADGVLLVNPGSLSMPRGRAKGTMALLMIENGRADATLLEP